MSGAQRNYEGVVIQVGNDDVAAAQRLLEVKQLERKTNMNCLKNEQGAQRNYEGVVIQVGNDDVAAAQRLLEVKQLERKTNMNCLKNEQVHLGAKVRHKLWKLDYLVKRVERVMLLK
ncbi:hypothetical protein Tco_0802087 [Tanacetum coccineum]|uniref:Uncharacterized protein n=1 Tax=Tanacetum coccineum TaxID=301880 RepID=A0ABQ4ZXT2_9ASTR